MTTTVSAELHEATGLTKKPGEVTDAFLVRLAKKANDLKDEEWQTLSEKAQLWINAGLEAIEKKRSPPVPDGFDDEVLDAPAPKAKKGAKAAPAKAESQKAPAKEVKGKKTAKKAESQGGRGPKGKFAKTDKIKVLVEANPFREGCKAFGWFGNIKNDMTVSEVVEAGTPRNHIRWAHSLGHISIGG